ncbi:hypothetical protein ECO2947_04890 [Escherichia coli]|nr:hypothetical protein ECO2947_04890 [Escherichia coli]
MLPWIFKKALERDAKFNDAGRNEDFALKWSTKTGTTELEFFPVSIFRFVWW